MATDALRSLWAEPRPANAPGPRAAGLGPGRSTDLLVRGGSGASPGHGAAPAAAASLRSRSSAPLPWRRTHPLVAVAVAFGTLTVVDIVRILTGSQGAAAQQCLRPPWS